MAYIVLFSGDDLLIRHPHNTFELPMATDYPDLNKLGYKGFLFAHTDSEEFILYDIKEIDKSELVTSKWQFVSFRDCRDAYKHPHYIEATMALQYLHWLRNHRFCGHCGHQLGEANTDRSLTCSACHHILYPYMGLAVIVAIRKDDKILLAHNSNFPENFYSVIAGFVDSGETLEKAVAREVMEEVGIKVKNIKYFGSQPWPFPNSLMIGFTADYDSGEVTPDNIEIHHADWFDIKNLPDIPHHYSIARQMIDDIIHKLT